MWQSRTATAIVITLLVGKLVLSLPSKVPAWALGSGGGRKAGTATNFAALFHRVIQVSATLCPGTASHGNVRNTAFGLTCTWPQRALSESRVNRSELVKAGRSGVYRQVNQVLR
jgi:hypothetical protein